MRVKKDLLSVRNNTRFAFLHCTLRLRNASKKYCKFLVRSYEILVFFLCLFYYNKNYFFHFLIRYLLRHTSKDYGTYLTDIWSYIKEGVTIYYATKYCWRLKLGLQKKAIMKSILRSRLVIDSLTSRNTHGYYFNNVIIANPL